MPFADWYGTLGGVARRFRNRPVMGGAFALDALRYRPNGLTGYWSFDSGPPLDRSGNGNDLALAGGASRHRGLPGGALAIDRPAGARLVGAAGRAHRRQLHGNGVGPAR